MRYNSAILAACLFSLAGLIVPSSLDGADAASAIKGKKFGSNAGTTADNCGGTLQGDHLDGDCKLDSKKTSKMDLDRKGHKVKKSKSRGR